MDERHDIGNQAKKGQRAIQTQVLDHSEDGLDGAIVVTSTSFSKPRQMRSTMTYHESMNLTPIVEPPERQQDGPSDFLFLPPGAQNSRLPPVTKRRRTDIDPDTDSDDASDRNNHTEPDHVDNDEESSLLWACPFYKLDYARYYHCIERAKLKRYSDVKQHIGRRHTLQGLQGPWKTHTERKSRQPTLSPDHLTDDEVLVLQKVPRRLNDQEKWYWMWDNLFKGHERPSSPFVKDGIAEPTMLLRRRSEETLMASLPHVLQSLNIYVSESSMPTLRDQITSLLFDDPQTQLPRFRQYPHNSTGVVEPCILSLLAHRSEQMAQISENCAITRRLHITQNAKKAHSNSTQKSWTESMSQSLLPTSTLNSCTEARQEQAFSMETYQANADFLASAESHRIISPRDNIEAPVPENPDPFNTDLSQFLDPIGELFL